MGISVPGLKVSPEVTNNEYTECFCEVASTWTKPCWALPCETSHILNWQMQEAELLMHQCPFVLWMHARPKPQGQEENRQDHLLVHCENIASKRTKCSPTNLRQMYVCAIYVQCMCKSLERNQRGM